MKIKISARLTVCAVLAVILLTIPTLSGCNNNNSSHTKALSDSDIQMQNAEIQQEAAPLTADDVKLMLENGETINDGEFAAPINLPTPSDELNMPDNSDWQSLDDAICAVSDSDIIIGRAIGDTYLWNTDEQGNVHTVKIRVRKAVYLTIDDWPDFQTTPKILATLKEHNVKATFFLNASDYYKTAYPPIKEAGHSIGNHSYSHASGSMYKSNEALLSQFERMNKFLNKTLGVQTNIIRLPGGSYSKNMGGRRYQNLKVLKENGYRVFDWTTTFGDSSSTATPQKSINRITSDCTDDFEIILMHHKISSLKALPTVIKNLRAKDYEFFPITDSTPEYIF